MTVQVRSENKLSNVYHGQHGLYFSYIFVQALQPFLFACNLSSGSPNQLHVSSFSLLGKLRLQSQPVYLTLRGSSCFLFFISPPPPMCSYTPVSALCCWNIIPQQRLHAQPTDRHAIHWKGHAYLRPLSLFVVQAWQDNIERRKSRIIGISGCTHYEVVQGCKQTLIEPLLHLSQTKSQNAKQIKLLDFWTPFALNL